MKKHILFLTVCIEVDSRLDSLFHTVQEFEQNTEYCFSDTENVRVRGMEILETILFDPNTVMP